jgi:hypothetical protein
MIISTNYEWHGNCSIIKSLLETFEGCFIDREGDVGAGTSPQ